MKAPPLAVKRCCVIANTSPSILYEVMISFLVLCRLIAPWSKLLDTYSVDLRIIPLVSLVIIL